MGIIDVQAAEQQQATSVKLIPEEFACFGAQRHPGVEAHDLRAECCGDFSHFYIGHPVLLRKYGCVSTTGAASVQASELGNGVCARWKLKAAGHRLPAWNSMSCLMIAGRSVGCHPSIKSRPARSYVGRFNSRSNCKL